MGVNVWLMKGFFDTIPSELDESARVDGATPAQVFWGVILPLAAPVLAVVGLFSFVGMINEFVIVSVADADAGSLHARPSGCAASSTSSTRSTGASFAAGVLLAAMPVVILFLFLQKFIVSGLTQGAVKG